MAPIRIITVGQSRDLENEANTGGLSFSEMMENAGRLTAEAIGSRMAIKGKRIVKTLGLVRGNTIRCRSMGRDIIAFFKHFVGGEIEDYTKLFGEAREQALDRMIEEAHALQANAIVSHRFASSEIMAGAAELLAYGTAVWVEDETEPAE